MKKLLIPFLLVFILAFSANADFIAPINVIFNDSFDYSNGFSLHGWTVQSIALPISSPFSTYAYGINTSNSTLNGNNYIRRIVFTPDITAGTYIFRFNGSIVQDTSYSYDGMFFEIYRRNLVGATYGNYFRFSPDYFGTGISKAYFHASWNSTGEICQFTAPSKPFYKQYTIIIDISNNLYYIYEDSTLKCDSKLFYDEGYFSMNMTALSLNIGADLGEAEKLFFDDLYVYTGVIDNEFPVNTPCDSDDDCASGKCEHGYCVLKGAKDDCSSNEECLSGLCINGKCTRPSAWTTIDSYKTSSFGNDSASNNLISLIIIIGFTAAIILGTRSGLGVVAGVGVYFALTIFFTIVGWLSVFILIGSIITVLIGIVLLFILGGDSS